MHNEKEIMVRFPAEWEPQSGVMLALPPLQSDWGPILERVHATYAQIIAAIARFERVLLLCDELPAGRGFIRKFSLSSPNIRLAQVPLNDTWARDFGPLTVMKQGRPLLLDFMFNGWGLKFASDRDNLVTSRLYEKKIFKKSVLYSVGPLVFEGGSVESDGAGTLMVTSRCLLSPNRNPSYSKEQIETILLETLGAKRVLWLDNGELEGDDTDAHVDTLARLCPGDTITCVSAPVLDRHHIALKRMEGELKRFRTLEGRPYTLARLPLPKACYDEAGKRLPATYANYLVINGAVLVPTYNDSKNDAAAMQIIGKIFAGREVIGIDCRALIEQHGSLHCVTMQLPEGVL